MAVTGVLLLNVGTPSALTKPSIRAYLAEFLSDPYVVDYPRWLWLPLLYGIILQVRPGRSLQRYQKIWTEAGSPMLVYMEQIAEQLRRKYRASGDRRMVFETAMRYGSPSISEALGRLKEASPGRVLSFPLFPQYSSTTTGTVDEAVETGIQGILPGIEHQCIPDYHAHPAYILALSQHIQRFWMREGRPQKVLFTFHGLPARFDARGDPYAEQCLRTAGLLADSLELENSTWSMSYQSRFGPEPWLRPYLDQVLVDLGRSGIGPLDVVAPGFAVDCLETLEEIALEGAETFNKAGGGAYRYIPALNAEPHHIEALSSVLSDWL